MISPNGMDMSRGDGNGKCDCLCGCVGSCTKDRGTCGHGDLNGGGVIIVPNFAIAEAGVRCKLRRFGLFCGKGKRLQSKATGKGAICFALHRKLLALPTQMEKGTE